MSLRRELFNTVVQGIKSLHGEPVLRIAIDGVDGAGKTVFADQLATRLRDEGLAVIRASVDSFHNAKNVRYRRGRASPQGFFLDSYNYIGLRAALLDPLSPGGSRRYRKAIFDCEADRPVNGPEEIAPVGAVLIFDGIFLHRPELLSYWDFSIFLDVNFDVSIPRGAKRGYGNPDPNAVQNKRYVEGQKIYLSTCRPSERATLVVDYNDLSEPRIVRRH